MRILCFSILFFAITSCATKKYTDANLISKGIKYASEEVYDVSNGQRKLLHKKEIVFTKNGRIKSSKTVDSGGNLLQTTEKNFGSQWKDIPAKIPITAKRDGNLINGNASVATRKSNTSSTKASTITTKMEASTK